MKMFLIIYHVSNGLKKVLVRIAVIVLQIVVIAKIATSFPLLTRTIKNGLITPDCVWKKIPRATGSLYFPKDLCNGRLRSEGLLFHIAVESGSLEVNVELTGVQMEAILLDTPEPLLTETIIEPCVGMRLWRRSAEFFLNQADEDGHIAIVTKREYVKGRPVYEVPVKELADGSIRPDMVIGNDSSSFNSSPG